MGYEYFCIMRMGKAHSGKAPVDVYYAMDSSMWHQLMEELDKDYRLTKLR